MSDLHPATSRPVLVKWVRVWLPAATAVGIVVTVVAAPLVGLWFGGQVLFVGTASLTLGLFALGSPIIATIALLFTMFLSLPLKEHIDHPIPPFVIAFVVLIASTALWMDRTPGRLRDIGAVEWTMAVYVMWNVYSMFAPHEYNDLSISVPRLILVGTLIPFVLYAVGRYTFDRPAAVLALFWTILAVAAYSAVMSILPFTGPTDWVWPRYIVDAPLWGDGRAVGVFNQPVVNGMVLALGFVIAVLLASWRTEPAWRRLAAFVVAVACGYGMYLTHTRAVWLCGAAVLIIGATLAKGFRTGFVAGLCLVTTVIFVNWSVFTSTDREAGGVGEQSQVLDRLNNAQTALWAATQKPITGWGIGRFAAVNTFHHQQWSLDTPWNRGFGNSSHENELGILAELGLIGLVSWICLLALIAYRLWKAYRTLPHDDLCGRPLAVIAIMAFAILVGTGLTVDLRFFDFPTAAIFLLAGIAIGWSDRLNRPEAAAGGDLAEQVRTRHA
jgi:O-antigen ligase